MGRVRREQDIVIHAGIDIHMERRIKRGARAHRDNTLWRSNSGVVILRKGEDGDSSNGISAVQVSEQKSCPEQGFRKVIGKDLFGIHSAILLLGLLSNKGFHGNRQ